MTYPKNSDDEPTPEQVGIAGDRLRSLVARIERLEEERKAIGSDISDIKKEAQSAGFDLPTFNEVLRLRRMKAEKRETINANLDIYMDAAGA